MLQTLFGLNGRLTRTGFWEVLTSVLLLDIAAGVAAITAFEHAFPSGQVVAASTIYEVVRWSLLAIAALSAWAVVAAHVKRAHDLGHGAVILLWVLVPVLGWLWLLYELGFKSGQNFRNRFGRPPLGHGDAQEAGERDIDHGRHGGGLFGHRREDVMPPVEARLDWTGAASEESTEAAAHRRQRDYDPGEALMRASERHDPPPAAPPEPVATPIATASPAVPVAPEPPVAAPPKPADDFSAALGAIRRPD
jgi:uncharacterized membrane protein YhaH (DUF805 family)